MVVGKLGVFLTLLTLSAPQVQAFSWRADKRADIASTRPTEVIQEQPIRNLYSVALAELQELESQPFCHRVAARLLVNNCQLVDGKDEATILTDSGRQVRDFVDSYAASLAICDLERGSFKIPPECAKFREASLSQIATRNSGRAQLHVSEVEIGLCLSAMATSDAAWSTWISYRHKALRFCEAARGENERDQSILLYQRLTKVIEDLTNGVEAELKKRMDELDNRARQTYDNLGQLSTRIDQLGDGLSKMGQYLSGDLEKAMKRSADLMDGGLQNAESLEKFLAALLNNIADKNAQMASAHELAVRQASSQVTNEVEALGQIVAAVGASSLILQEKITSTTNMVDSLARRHDVLEDGLGRLLVTTQHLASNHNIQAERVEQAFNITNELLDALEETATTASTLNKSFLSRAPSGTWWPHILCPVASLVLGSYGLAPSAFRNLGLLALGEGVGFVVSISTSGHLDTVYPFFLSNTTIPGLRN
ncbi:nuclear fusion protein KAR5 [Podospora conica]|nr:nuclear fusion protein KAR5 [Schizothecium conicum]